MRIVLDCEQLKNPHTGLYTFTSDLARVMQNIVTEEDRLIFFTGKLEEKYFGDTKTYLRHRPWSKLIPYFFCPRINIWHTTYQLSRYTGGGFFSKKVLTIHDLNFLYEDTSEPMYERFMRKYQKYIDRVDHIVAISEFVKHDILKHLDVKGKPVSVVHNGYHVEEFPEYDNPIYKPQKPYIFSMGMINKKKNFKSLPCLLEGNDYELIIAGKKDMVEPDYLDSILEEADKYRVRERVKFLGAISNEDKYWYLKNCTAFAFPSLAEGFGLPVLEAMHFGKPVFLSNLTSLPEIGGEYAYYFENFTPTYMQEVFNKSMQQFNRDENRYEEVKKYARTFSYEKAAREYYEIYESLMKK